MAMRRALVITPLLLVLLLHFTPSSTPFSPHNTGPLGLSETAKVCKFADNASVVILGPGASAHGVKAAETPIVDPFANAGDPYVVIANAGGRAVFAANATPLVGPGKALVVTGPASYANATLGPFALGLATGNVTVYHASLFANKVFEKNRQFIEQVCREPVRLVLAGGDAAHYYHQLEEAAAPWAAALALATISLYLAVRGRQWRSVA